MVLALVVGAGFGLLSCGRGIHFGEACSNLSGGGPSQPYVLAGKDQVYLQWPQLPSAESYNIYWSDSADVSPCEANKIRNVNQTDFTHGGLNIDRQYFYQITANIQGKESNLSPVISASTMSQRLIFVSSATVTGSMGGLTGANAICDNLAFSQKLPGADGSPGHYAAIVSTSTSDAFCNVIGRTGQSANNNCGLAYPPRVDNSADLRNVQGIQVASSLSSLFSSTNLNNPVQYSENGTNVGAANVLTGTSASGIRNNGAANFCSDLNVADPSQVRFGRADQAAATWIDFSQTNCNSSYQIYCIRVR